MGRYTVHELAGRIAECETFEQICRYLDDFPSAIMCSTVAHQIMVILPKLEEKTEKHQVNFRFVFSIINALAAWAVRGENAEPSYIDDRSDEAGYMILSRYYHILVAACEPKQNPFEAIRDPDVMAAVPARFGISKEEIRRMIAIGYLFIKFDRWGVSDRRLWDFLQEVNLTGDFVQGFLQTGCATIDVEIVANCVEHVMRHIDRMDERREVMPYSADLPDEEVFPKWVAFGGLEPMTKVILEGHISEYDAFDAELIRSDAIECCRHLCNTFTDEYVRWHKIHEYALGVSPLYNLTYRLGEIDSRYQGYFGSDVLKYVGDIHSACEDAISSKANQITQQTTVFMAVERIIYQIMRDYPRVEPQVYDAFMHDILNLKKDYGGRNYDPVILVKAMMPIIQANYDRMRAPAGEPGMESFNVIMGAMEGVMEDDPDDSDYSYRDIRQEDRANRTSKDRGKTSAAFKRFKEREDEVNQKVDGVGKALQKALNAGKRTILLNGKKKTALGTLRSIITSLAVFHATKVGFILMLMLKHYMKKTVLPSERQKFMDELDTQIPIIEAKIQDAEASGDNEAKYELMKTLGEFKATRRRLEVAMRK